MLVFIAAASPERIFMFIMRIVQSVQELVNTHTFNKLSNYSIHLHEHQ